MKSMTCMLICSCALLLCACAGGSTARNPLPPDGIAGMNELNRGNGRYQTGCYAQALEHFFKAHEHFVASDHMAGVAMSLNNIGNVYRAIGDLDSALLFYEESCISYMDLQDPEGVLQALSNKAAALIDADRFDDADQEFARAAKIITGSRKPFGPLLKNRGVLLLKKEDYPQAQSVLEDALKNTDPTNLPEMAAVNFTLGTLMIKINRPDRALRHYEAALSADQLSSYYQGIADDLAAIGSVYQRRGHAQQAVGFFKRAVKIYALIRNKPKVAAVWNQLTAASQTTGTNLELTEFFVERWTRGEALEMPCR